MKTPKPPGDRRTQANQYDKIWRENLRTVLPGLIRNVLKLGIARSEPLPDKIQVTHQRETDLLSKITDYEGNTFVLHIEMQTRDEPGMIYRMLEYRVMAEQLYKLPVKQYVIYLGPKTPGMATTLDSPGLQFEYTLLTLSQIPCELFLACTHPEEKLLAVLADFGEKAPAEVIHSVLSDICITPEGVFFENRYLHQLRILMQLRNLGREFEKAMESIAVFFKEERDPFYIRGERRGLEKVIRNLLKSGQLTDEQIAEVAEVSVTYVAELRCEIEGKK